MKKFKWCKHFKLVIDNNCIEHIPCFGWQLIDQSETWVDDEFNYCPYCGKEKPKYENS